MADELPVVFLRHRADTDPIAVFFDDATSLVTVVWTDEEIPGLPTMDCIYRCYRSTVYQREADIESFIAETNALVFYGIYATAETYASLSGLHGTRAVPSEALVHDRETGKPIVCIATWNHAMREARPGDLEDPNVVRATPLRFFSGTRTDARRWVAEMD